jgi:hypothetical protein
MLRILEKFDYSPPHIELYNDGKLEVYPLSETAFGLKVNGERWMAYDYFNHSQVLQVFSHYDLANGHCVCSGLGFGARENWLLTKKNVSKITVLEKNKEVIEYHEYIKSPLLDHIEVIHCDASEYNGKCNTLLLDHYEFEPCLANKHLFFTDVEKCVKNIEHDVMWFWPIEHVLLLSRKMNKFQSYYQLKQMFPTLPELDFETINLYVGMFHLK